MVIFIPLVVSPSVMARWQPGGDIHPTLLARTRDVRASGLAIGHLLRHHGESDGRWGRESLPASSFPHAIWSSIRQKGVASPLYVSEATRWQWQRLTPTIQEA